MKHTFEEKSKVFAFRDPVDADADDDGKINVVPCVLFFSLSFATSNKQTDYYFFFIKLPCNFSKQQNSKGE